MRVVYFVQLFEDGPIKIGFTSRMTIRMTQHQLRFGQTVRLLGVMKGYRSVEREMHARFRHLRVSREELFRADPELLRFIEEAASPWDGTDDEKGAPVKIDRKLVIRAKAVATSRGIALAELLTEILETPVSKAYVQMLRDLEAKG
jgi:hypothetical protein